VSILFDSAPSQGLIGDFKIAVESTGQRTVPWPLSLKFESSLPDDAALRLEDILGLMFRVEQEKFKIEIQLPKGNQGRAVKAAVQKVLTEQVTFFEFFSKDSFFSDCSGFETK